MTFIPGRNIASSEQEAASTLGSVLESVSRCLPSLTQAFGCKHQMRVSPMLKRFAAVVGCVLLLGIGYQSLWDPSGRPFCHKQVMSSFWIWMDERGDRSTFPNIEGNGFASMSAITEEMGGRTNWMRGYRYVPGLNRGDPGHLVLMYLDAPTRWTWHGNTPSRFGKKAWIIVPVDFTIEGRERAIDGPGECSERVSKDVFVARLLETIEYLRANRRPYAEKVAAETEEFIKNLDAIN